MIGRPGADGAGGAEPCAGISPPARNRVQVLVALVVADTNATCVGGLSRHAGHHAIHRLGTQSIYG
jgi:hypothetical protein